MRIALIGDIHANLPALERVIEHARRYDVQAFWNIGDTVGYGAHPNQVVDLLREIEAVSIAGNYDRKVLRFPQKSRRWEQKKHPTKYRAFEYAYQSLTPENRQYLAALPDERRLEAGPWRVLLIHATPASNEEYLTPHTPTKQLQELAELAKVDLYVHGHSHRSFLRRVANVWFVNTGSVGRPDDGDPRAEYALLHIEDKQVQIDHHRLTYDVQRAVNAMREAELPPAFGDMLLRGQDLEAVLKGEER